MKKLILYLIAFILICSFTQKDNSNEKSKIKLIINALKEKKIIGFDLSKGDMVFANEKLFFKREKSIQKTNHHLVGYGNGIKETLAFIIRRFNLITYTAAIVRKEKEGGVWFVFLIYPYLLYFWFIQPTFNQTKLACMALLKKQKNH